MKTLSVLACVAGLVASGLPCAQAATVTYAFSVSGAAGSGSGSFQFDDSTGVPGAFGETEYALTSFSFAFNGATFGLGDLDGQGGLALFDGPSFLGLEAGRTAPGAVSFSFSPAIAGEDPFFATARAFSSITFRLDPGGVVSEPGTVGLGLAAMVVLGACRRRRQAG